MEEEMGGRDVGDRVWKDHYYDCCYGRDVTVDCVGLKPDITADEGAPRLRVMMAEQYNSRERNSYGFTGKVVGVYLYVFFDVGQYEDPYITRFIPFGTNMNNAEQNALVTKTKIHVTKDGTITITPVNGQTTIHQLPVPDSDRDYRVVMQRQMDAGWPVSFKDDE